jgi:hypothetical protein
MRRCRWKCHSSTHKILVHSAVRRYARLSAAIACIKYYWIAFKCFYAPLVVTWVGIEAADSDAARVSVYRLASTSTAR